jgi:hypothetical protein
MVVRMPFPQEQWISAGQVLGGISPQWFWGRYTQNHTPGLRNGLGSHPPSICLGSRQMFPARSWL